MSTTLSNNTSVFVQFHIAHHTNSKGSVDTIHRKLDSVRNELEQFDSSYKKCTSIEILSQRGTIYRAIDAHCVKSEIDMDSSEVPFYELLSSDGKIDQYVLASYSEEYDPEKGSYVNTDLLKYVTVTFSVKYGFTEIREAYSVDVFADIHRQYNKLRNYFEEDSYFIDNTILIHNCKSVSGVVYNEKTIDYIYNIGNIYINIRDQQRSLMLDHDATFDSSNGNYLSNHQPRINGLGVITKLSDEYTHIIQEISLDEFTYIMNYFDKFFDVSTDPYYITADEQAIYDATGLRIKNSRIGFNYNPSSCYGVLYKLNKVFNFTDNVKLPLCGGREYYIHHAKK
jgi:hypothetical protein